MHALTLIHFALSATLVALLTACGGGGSAPAAGGAAATPVAAAAGEITISAATDATKNGNYKPDVTKSAGYFGGFSTDGKMDLAFVLNATNQVQRAMVWFHETPTVNRYFGCDSVATCAGVSMTLATKEMAYTAQKLNEVVNLPADNVPLVPVAGGQSVVVDGKFTFK